MLWIDLIFARNIKIGQVNNVIFSDEAPFRLFGASGKRLVQRRKCERFSEACVAPTVKHSATIHV